MYLCTKQAKLRIRANIDRPVIQGGEFGYGAALFNMGRIIDGRKSIHNASEMLNPVGPETITVQ